ncbi:glycosyltransferase [Sanguibacter sp. Leaf3]|uniref:glycosyltransferase n=1 Tax=Sanguibacter sp. Leaf3 TaxID=1736209 RepID=UPI0006F36CAB|nr:glycosyltransferase [Sanguibacter sp. Leaf3]KQT95859.1 glycosyl transferase [Sanguibacter sp. Leaf3]
MTPEAVPAFSVLLPVYAGDDPAFVRRAFRSVTSEQTLRPAEVVVVRDGPVGDALAAVLEQLRTPGDVPVTVVEIAENVGLARALERGLARCAHDVVARMDADDVSLPERFAQQVPLLAEGYDLVGSAIQEFTDENEPGIVRVPPLSDDDVLRASRFVSPFNHPSVVYRASVVGRVGGYEHLPLMEDYWLFVRMLSAGARACNIAEPLVLYRVGAGAYARRGGLQLLRSEVRLQVLMRRIGWTSWPQLVRNVLVRGGYRLVPEALRKVAYRRLVVRRDRSQDL